MSDIINQLIGLGYMLALYGALWLANMCFGIANSLKGGSSWDWRKFLSGWRHAALGALGLTFTVVSILFIPSVFAYNHITIGDEWKSAISLLAIIAGLAGGILTYAKKAIAAIVAFANPENVQTKVTTSASNWNTGSIETITGDKTTKELLQSEGVSDD